MSPGSARVGAAAVPGCQHVLANGKACQDAAGGWIGPTAVIVAVADGHGDASYTSADEGARQAVAVALDVLAGAAVRLADPVTPDLEAEISANLKRRVAFEWNRRVKHHARMVANRDEGVILWPTGVTGDWDGAVRPYGCTLLAAVFGVGGTLWFQLGDGDMLHVDAAGPRRVFPAAEKSMGTETWSLSNRDCVERMQLRIEPTGCELAVLATDGVSDQYAQGMPADDTPTFEVEWGARMLERIRSRGWADTLLDLPRWLALLARDGDDASVALAWMPEGPS